ncbi:MULTISPECIES: UMP kinase [Dethiosulfovibrio]|uniref:Uridylate kinase n=2 Tax=Dethiosulfovibrio TaxID=47054 RepID=A0ABS9EPY9_9BACT|nr:MULTISPECIES: UMP kinase [Dethiosulfovibrio]MCF4113418.1 UMP kinase [Dethiosulfovibrio russensis]MCF4141888.1 UMP kinase [Dethiosulfovibrio marinus]MCF4144042.1 UMP kinase [Dethiosulfovibrio acidaminovorans]MEA3284807.1 UMP kinase [Synergistota bacterium]
MAEFKYKRILLKLSGEVLAGKLGFGLDFGAIRSISHQIVEISRAGVEVGLVVGGGNFFRGKQAVDEGIERSQADYMGMLGTVINSLALQDVLEKQGIPTRVQTAIQMQEIAEPYIRRRALRHMDKGRVLIFSAGTGSPYFSTDTAAALRAAEIGAQCLVKATKVDGIYDKDPMKNSDAVLYSSLTYMDALRQRIEVMDAAAFSLCMENKIPIVVMNVLEDGRLADFLIQGKKIGTIVSGE